MASHDDAQYEQLMREVARKMETSRLTQRPSRASFGQPSRRHSARIEKPNAQPSPHTPERRRIVRAARHYSSLDEHYRRMMGIDGEEQNYSSGENIPFNNRPVSWHPSSSTTQQLPFDTNAALPLNISPTFHYASYQSSPSYHQYQPAVVEPTWSQYMHGEVAAISTPFDYATPSTAAWNAINYGMPTFINHPGVGSFKNDPYDEQYRRADREPSVELVALGLYDEPGTTIKIGSKLEEECEAPEAMEAEDPDDESSEEEEEELPKPEDSHDAPSSLPLLTLAGQSFFFDDDDRMKDTWWAQQQTQPEPLIRTSNPYGWI